MRMGVATGMYANWLEARDNRHQTLTWLVTVFGEHADYFLEVVRQMDATVEELEGGGDTERYVLRVGDSGTGWAEP
jgi:hypothetical protein